MCISLNANISEELCRLSLWLCLCLTKRSLPDLRGKYRSYCEDTASIPAQSPLNPDVRCFIIKTLKHSVHCLPFSEAQRPRGRDGQTGVIHKARNNETSQLIIWHQFRQKKKQDRKPQNKPFISMRCLVSLQAHSISNLSVFIWSSAAQRQTGNKGWLPPRLSGHCCNVVCILHHYCLTHHFKDCRIFSCRNSSGLDVIILVLEKEKVHYYIHQSRYRNSECRCSAGNRFKEIKLVLFCIFLFVNMW